MRLFKERIWVWKYFLASHFTVGFIDALEVELKKWGENSKTSDFYEKNYLCAFFSCGGEAVALRRFSDHIWYFVSLRVLINVQCLKHIWFMKINW